MTAATRAPRHALTRARQTAFIQCDLYSSTTAFRLARSCFHSSSGVREDASPAQAAVKPYYVTTPIFYVNSVPHIGHLHSMVVADVLTRYNSLRYGKMAHGNSILATGTDEHGLKIQRAAEAQGVDPKELCDRVSVTFRDLAKAADIEHDDFIRTTEPRHRTAAQHLWRRLIDGGHIYKGLHRGWYAVSDEAYYPESQVEERIDPTTGDISMVSKESGQRVEWTEEENYMFRLSAFRDRILAWMDANPLVVVGAQAQNLVESLRSAPLNDLSVSRPASRLSWGIPIPDDPAHTMYVWVDALANYLTVTGYPWADGGGNGAWPADVHVVGKDIIRFHAVYWPALLMAAGIAPPKAVLSHGHWTMRDEKMSKSRGNVADPFEAIETWGVDTIRFYLMRAPGQLWNDADWSPERVVEHYRKDLAGQLGNLLGRISSPRLWERLPPAFQSGAGLIFKPEDPRQWPEADVKVMNGILELPDEVDRLMGQFEIPRAVDAIFRVIAEMHRRMQETEPWKQDRQPQQAHRSLFLAAETLRFAGILLQPVMPRKAAELLDALGIPPDKRGWLQLSMKAKIPRGKGVLPYSGGRPSGLFPALKKTVEVLPAA